MLLKSSTVLFSKV